MTDKSDIQPQSHAHGQKVDSPPSTSTCCHGFVDPAVRNLVINLDGTSNKFGANNTNVIELYSLLDKNKQQLTWYNSGIGTYARPSWKSPAYWRMVIHNKIDLAIAWEFDRTVMGAYQWLSENYQEGDRIFLFGFSRGAFQARVLSAMIHKVGLIHKGNEMQIPFAYELYADPSTDELEPEDDEEKHVQSTRKSTNTEERLSIAERFKRTFSHRNVKVHFVEVWDTVSSIGVLRGSKMLPGTIDGMKHVCYFRHALALDERRVKFLPEFAYGGSGIPEEDLGGKIPRIKEVWFAGTHSDIGGGNSKNPKLNRTRPPLRWMVFEAAPLGLITAQFNRDLLDEELVDVKESLTGVWRLFEYLPFRRLTYSRREDAKKITWSWHRGKPRKIQHGQKIHNSLLSSTVYTSKASPPPLGDIDFWKTLQDIAQSSKTRELSQLYETWVELDLYDHIKDALQELNESAPLDTLREFAMRNEGKRALYEAIMDILVDRAVSLDIKQRIMEKTIDILDTDSFSFPKRKLGYVLPDIKDSETSGLDCIEKKFLCRFCCFTTNTVLRRQEDYVFSTTFSPNGQRLFFGSSDRKVRMWDVHTGSQIGNAFMGHEGVVYSVAVSPDGKWMVSGSADQTLRLWDIETRNQVGDPWTGHTSYITHVAFSPNGKHVVSGSYDGTVCLWDVKTGSQIGDAWTGHLHWVNSVAYSPDGRLVVSGSNDRTVRIWDTTTHEKLGEPLEHEVPVLSVSFSPDGKSIVSGMYDGTIHFWDVETRQPIGEPLCGHGKNLVRSVCFSPDGRLLVSGCDDRTIRIWDVKTGKQVGEPLRGHGNWAMFVTFSPDGKKVASVSNDDTIRIWEVEDYITFSRL